MYGRPFQPVGCAAGDGARTAGCDMAEAFGRIIRDVARRSGINMLLEQGAYVLTVGAAALAAAVVFQRALSVHVLAPWMLAALAGVMLGAIAILTYLNRPRAMQTALLIDERLGLRERFSTALALARADDSFAVTARVEAMEVARHLSPAGRFPIRLSRRWWYAGGGWMLVLALAVWLPEMDLFGAAAAGRKQQDEQTQRELAAVQVREETRKVDAAIKRLDPNMEKDLEALAKADQSMEPSELKLAAIQKLTDLKDKVKQMQAAGDNAAAEELKNRLKDMRPGKLDPALAKIQRSMAKGDFDAATKALREFQKDVAEGKITPEQQRQLAEQMAALAKQLATSAKDQAELKQEMEKAGIKPETADALAKMTPEQMREALEKQGLTPEQIDKLMQQAQAMAAACKSCQGLSDKLGAMAGAAGAGKLSAADMEALAGQLSQLEIQELRAAMGQASLDQIDQAIAALGEGQGLMEGQGLGEGSGDSDVESGIPGPGMGKGQGYGRRPIDERGKVAMDKPSTVNNDDGRKTPPIASWAFQGAQIRGEARKELQDVLKAQQDGFAEAVEEKQVPRRHEKLVKDYYDRLEKGN